MSCNLRYPSFDDLNFFLVEVTEILPQQTVTQIFEISLLEILRLAERDIEPRRWQHIRST